MENQRIEIVNKFRQIVFKNHLTIGLILQLTILMLHKTIQTLTSRYDGIESQLKEAPRKNADTGNQFAAEASSQVIIQRFRSLEVLPK